MRRVFVFALAPALLLFALTASASPLKFRWDQCFGDGGVQNKAFACNVNTGADVVVASFVPFTLLPGVADIESRVDIAFGGAAVPAWWQFFNAGTCRQGAIGLTASDGSGIACSDWSGGTGIGLIALVTVAPTTVSVSVTSYIPAGTADLAAGQEYFAYSLRVNHTKTVGATSCAGCSVPACLGMQYIEFDLETTHSFFTLSPDVSDTQWLAFWQGGPAGGTSCIRLTPARTTTWSAVKSLYR
jgi:hypothetical protein